MLKDLNVVTDADGAKSYQIIKKYSTEAQASRPLAATAAQNLQAQPSFFSMNNGKSLRLQKWGLWIAYEDQVNKTVYWYNSLTKSGQWNKPEEVTPYPSPSPPPPRLLLFLSIYHSVCINLYLLSVWLHPLCMCLFSVCTSAKFRLYIRLLTCSFARRNPSSHPLRYNAIWKCVTFSSFFYLSV